MKNSRLKNSQNSLQNKISFEKGAVLLFLIVVFGVFFSVGKVRTYTDTQSYLYMVPFREPGYALLLKAFVFLFGEFGFTILGFLQNVLAVYSIYVFSDYIGSKYKGKYVMPVIAVCMVFPYVITPMFASSKIILTNAMLSEGVTLPLYHLFFLFLLKAVWENDRRWKYLIISLILSFLLIITRGQMVVTLIGWLVVAVILNSRKGQRKKIVMCILLFLLTIGCRTICINSYHLIINGQFAGTTYGPVTILSNVVYVSVEEDEQVISNTELRELFREIYSIADDGQMLFKYAPKNFSEEAVFYSSMHDNIKDLAIYPTLQQYVQDNEGIEDFMEKCIRVDVLATTMCKELLSECFARWFAHYVRNVIVGLIRTVAIVHPFLNIPVMLGYFILIAMGTYCYWRDKKNKTVKLFLLTALLTAGNVAAVSFTIMCLSRYMVYNTALIYMTAFLLLVEIWGLRKNQQICD